MHRKHVARLMRAMGRQGPCPARRPRTPHSSHAYPCYPDLVQGLPIVRPNHVWGSDLPDVRLPEEFVD